MHYSKLTVLSILCTLLPFSNAQHNVTVNNTSPLIQYEGKVASAPICIIQPDGNILGGQPGCYNAPSQCARNASMGLGGTSDAASFSFKGSAIYINSMLTYFSPMYTVTLDGNSTDVDGVRPSGVFICDTIFSQTGLDPNVEHKVRLSAKGLSPNRNTSIPGGGDGFVFSLLSYIYTESGDGNTTTATNTTSTNGTSTTGGSNQPANTTTDSPNSGAQAARLSSWGLLAATVAFLCAAVL